MFPKNNNKKQVEIAFIHKAVYILQRSFFLCRKQPLLVLYWIPGPSMIAAFYAKEITLAK